MTKKIDDKMWYIIHGNSTRSEILIHNEPGKPYAKEK